MTKGGSPSDSVSQAIWPGEDEWEEIDRLTSENLHAETVAYMTARLAEDPGRWQAIRYRAFAKREMGDAEGARADFDELVRLVTRWLEEDPEHRMRGLRAEAYESIGDAEAARTDRQTLLPRRRRGSPQSPTNGITGTTAPGAIAR